MSLRGTSARDGLESGKEINANVVPGTGTIWMNGKLVEWKDATIHIASHVIHYGSGVFEGARCWHAEGALPSSAWTSTWFA